MLRDTTSGSNGTLALTSREISMAAVGGGRVKVRVGQGISDVQPASITCNQDGAQALTSVISAVIAGSSNA